MRSTILTLASALFLLLPITLGAPIAPARRLRDGTALENLEAEVDYTANEQVGDVSQILNGIQKRDGTALDNLEAEVDYTANEQVGDISETLNGIQ